MVRSKSRRREKERQPPWVFLFMCLHVVLAREREKKRYLFIPLLILSQVLSDFDEIQATCMSKKRSDRARGCRGRRKELQLLETRNEGLRVLVECLRCQVNTRRASVHKENLQRSEGLSST